MSGDAIFRERRGEDAAPLPPAANPVAPATAPAPVAPAAAAPLVSGAAPPVPAIAIHDLTVQYGERPALWDIDLTIPQGVLAAVVGPNGAGKTTLLKAILGLIPTVSGEVQVLGERYTPRRQTIAYVPQRSSVDWDFPTTALDVVLMGSYGRLGWLRRPGRAERQAAADALARVGMAAYARRQISQLSGGQQQRVFLARALVQDAPIYLLDEPFQGVDAVTEAAIIDILRDLRRRGRTLLIVHHDLATVTQYFDWVTLLNVRVLASGPTAATFTLENLQRTYGAAVREQVLAGPGGPQTPPRR